MSDEWAFEEEKYSTTYGFSISLPLDKTFFLIEEVRKVGKRDSAGDY